MKDKRQRMAMAWPYGISDPNLYAYIMNAAASLSQYPYGLGSAGTSPLNYYASLNLQRAAAAYSPYTLASPLRPRPELLTNGSTGSILRPPLPTDTVQPLVTPSACSLHSSREISSLSTPGAHLLSPPGTTSTCASESCNCHIYYSGLAAAASVSSTPSSLPTPIPISHAPTPAQTTTSTPSLFQPYKSDVERA